MGHRIAARSRDSNARFSNQVQYGVEDIKAALEGRSLWRELIDDMAAGMESLRERYEEYADAIESRFTDGDVPKAPAEKMRQTRAVVALTEETNRVVRSKFDRMKPEPGKTLGDGPGTRRTAFPMDHNPNGRSIFDSDFKGEEMDMYRDWILEPGKRPALIDNWDEYGQEDFGGR
jgi:hypothetical protein